MKGTREMISDDAAPSAGDSTAGETSSLPFDIRVAHQARMYDYLLGGKDNFAADRVAAEAMLKIYPDTGSSARPNRAFLGRAVRDLAGEARIRSSSTSAPAFPRRRTPTVHAAVGRKVSSDCQ
jgi:hypothetical protein